MHPLEQLRYVARGWATDDRVPAAELAEVLAELAEQSPATLLHACRRLIEYFPSSGRLWWLSARALSAPEPVEAIWQAAADLDADPTAGQLLKSLPAGAAVALVGQALPEVVRALRRLREGSRKGARGQRVFVVEALAAGPGGLLVDAGAASRLTGLAGREVWGVVPMGTVLPAPLWEQVLQRSAGAAGPAQPVGPGAFSALVGPSGLASAAELLAAPECPPVAELLSWKS